jgi:diguanylate cyclase (GGDEF)-like protein
MAPSSVYLQVQSLSQKKKPAGRLVLTLLMLSCVLIVTLAACGLWMSRQDRLQDARIYTSNIARALSSHAETAMKAADLVLEDIVERAESGGLHSSQNARLRKHLERMAAKTSELHGLFVYDERGEWIATSLGRVMKANNSDREYFKYHQTHPGQQIHIGAPVRSRSTGVWIIPVSRRLQYPDGSFAGVALATLRLDLFESAYGNLNVGASGAILFALDKGILLYRKPFQERYIGMDISAGSLMKLYRSQGPAGSAMLTAKVDGVERLYSYQHLNGFPLIVAAALSSQDIYAEWWNSALLLTLGVLIFIAILAFLGKKLLHQLAIRERLEQQLHVASDGLAKANTELSVLALKDGLTNLANRRAFDAALTQEFWRSKRNKAAVSLIMADVDWFKKFNDSYGHPEGDRCLQQVASVLSAQLSRHTDLAARYGGEEFAIVLPDTDMPGAMMVAQRIQAAISALHIPHQGAPEGKVTLSLGIATIAPPNATCTNPADLLKSADEALYFAKKSGRNQVSASTRALCEVRAA